MRQVRCLSHALSTYKAPDVYCMPDDMAVKFLEPEDNPYGPLGAKAVGEPPLMYGIGMFFALRNAMKAFRPDTDLTLDAPMTAERLLLDLLYRNTRTTAPCEQRAGSRLTVPKRRSTFPVRFLPLSARTG